MRSTLKFMFALSQERLKDDFPLAAITLPKSRLDYGTALTALSYPHAAPLHEKKRKTKTKKPDGLAESSRVKGKMAAAF